VFGRHRPRLIFLENVQGFAESSVLMSWKAVLRCCGYRWRQYLLSPINCVGIPNHRTRFYMTIEHSSCCRWMDDSVDNDELIHSSIYTSGRPTEPAMPRRIQDFIRHDIVDREALLIPLEILTKAWAKTRLSIISIHDTQTYCFTSSYGRLYDKSSGSLLLEGADSALESSANATLDDLPSLHGRLRLFDPNELLLIAGFPSEFLWPEHIPLQKRYASIGNSINVVVVSALMREFFN
jgi:tRNA (cytosine38-C5)-methyltransferase